jgi:dTDP-alpha-D-glucose dehydrogenase
VTPPPPTGPTLDSFRERVRDRSLRVGIVGFGYVGSCLGAVLADRGFSILAIDVDESLIAGVREGRVPFNEPGLAEALARAHAEGRLDGTVRPERVSEADLLLLCVGTPLGDGFRPDTRQILEVARTLAPHLRGDQLVILKSTAPPGTTEDLLAPALFGGDPAPDERLLAFCPERLAEGSALRELRTIPVVVGGMTPLSRELACVLWEEGLGVDTVPVADPRTAELAKLADNQWIDLNVALANELARLSQVVGVDVLEVIEAANSLPKGDHHVNILRPSMGVGGSCLTKDPWFLDHLAREGGDPLVLPAAGRRVNDAMPGYTISLMGRGLESTGRTLRGAEVAVLGLAFKSNTGDCRETPVRPALEALEAAGARLRIHDPLVSERDAAEVTDRPLNPSLEETVRGADCVAFFTGHDAFRAIEPRWLARQAPDAVIVDGRMYFDRKRAEEMRSLGLTFLGVGR